MPRPLVLIHGWSDRSASFAALRKHLAGIPGSQPFQINLADYVSMDDEVRFDDLVAGMQRAWKAVGLPERPGSVDAVVHSTGGLVIRDWLTTYAPGAAPVKRLLMLAPANFGSPIAHKGRAFYGRIVKGFNSEKPFQTGARLLKGLELASPYAWELAMRDRFGPRNPFGPGQVLCTVLIGNTGYDGIMAAANEDGSDGTVRASSANLNCARLDVDFATNPRQPTFRLRTAPGATAFRLLDNDNHSTAAMKDRGPCDPGGRAAITRALTVKDADFDAWCEECAAATRAITARGEAAKQPGKYGYQNTVTRVTDDAGVPVQDYFLEFYLDDADDKQDWFSGLFHRDVIRTVHAHADDKSRRSLMVDCTTLYRGIDREQEYMKISLTAAPDFKTNGHVGYRTFADTDIGGIRLSRSQILKVFQPHRTLLVDIRIRRERAPEVFRINKG